MTYHTNHSWCNESIWNENIFDGEVMVYFGKNIRTYSIDGYKNKIENPDWKNLIHLDDFFNEKKYKEDIEERKKDMAELNKEFIEDPYHKERFIRTGKYLNPKVLEWLEENIKDKKDTNEKTPLEERKGWAIGTPAFNYEQFEFTIFFARQLDALKFIRKFSIFKEPTQYFDYFEDRQKIEMHPKKILDIINKHSNLNLNIDDYQFNTLTDNESQDMNYKHFVLKDWEKENDDELDLTDEEKDLAIKEIYAIDEQIEEDNLEIER